MTTDWYEKGRGFKADGDLESAIACFNSMIEQNAQDQRALLELYKCYVAVGRQKESIDVVNKLMRIYVREGLVTEALTVYGEVHQLDEDHAFDQDVQLKLTDWLEKVGDFSSAIRALQNYANRYEHDRRSPGLLLRAAKISETKSDDRELTKGIVCQLNERYPDSEAAHEAAILYFDF